MSVKDNAEIGLYLGILILVGYILWQARNWFSGINCITNVGSIPGVTGATKAQTQAAQTTACRLRAGGKTIWSCGSDYDYLQPWGQIVTEVRHTFTGQVFGNPNSFTDVPLACYTPPCGGGICSVTPCFNSGGA
jgi:hypothetical protein